MTIGADILIEVRIERGTEVRRVQMAVDAAELVICSEHPGGWPSSKYTKRLMQNPLFYLLARVARL